jgi:hypothetical protein
MRMRTLRKVTAIVLLAWAAADITVPSLCISDSAQAPQPEMNFLLATTATLESPDSQRFPSDSRFHYEDDCFCCCPHIVPMAQFNSGHVSLSSVQSRITSPGLFCCCRFNFSILLAPSLFPPIVR